MYDFQFESALNELRLDPLYGFLIEIGSVGNAKSDSLP
jgi:hypothetical protein